MCWRYTTYFLLKNTKNSLFFFSCLRFSLIFHSSIVCAEARFQLPLRIIAVLLFCMCLYCHPLLGSLSHHVCCCHCWFMRQLWGRRISLLSPTTQETWCYNVWLVIILYSLHVSLLEYETHVAFKRMRNKNDRIKTKKTIFGITTWCNMMNLNDYKIFRL